MAQSLHRVLGRHLFVPQPDQFAADGNAWLSPQALRHKVVVRMKVKPGVCVCVCARARPRARVPVRWLARVCLPACQG
jgi:hypothetical protein